MYLVREKGGEKLFIRKILNGKHMPYQTLQDYQHPCLPKLYEVTVSEESTVVVEEYIEGQSCGAVDFSEKQFRKIVGELCSVLEFLHGNGIIHRDIKPHNIMVLRDGSVKVTDFGIAQLASAAQNTMTQEAIGSVHYISPEQAKGSHVDCRTDIYSAGVVLYEMLTGRLPFEGDTPVAVAIQHIKSIPVPPCDLNPEVPRALEAITMKAMAPELNQRYGSAEEMLDDLKEFRKNPDFQVAAAPEAEAADEPTMVVPAKVITASVRVPVERREPERSSQPERKERRREEDEYDYDDEPPRQGGALPAVAAVLVILVFIVGMGYFLINFFIKDLFAEAPEYDVPNLLGYTLEQLEQNKSILGDFTLEVKGTIYSTEFPENQICEQSPEANTRVREGDKVITVSVSGGEDNMFMPPVNGWDARQALQKLQNEMGLQVKTEYAPSETITEGYVISYTPIDGIKVERGDEVTIVISTGPEQKQATVIPFVNVPIEDVKAQIKQLGLEVGKVDAYYSDEYAEGRVIWQSVNPGDKVDKGTAIDLWVSKGPEEPEPTPSEELPGSDPPVESDAPVEPTQDAAVPTSTQTITVDLNAYSGSVRVTIIVGEQTIYDNNVDANLNSTVSRQVSGSGLQNVSIYINETLVNSYPLDFGQ